MQCLICKEEITDKRRKKCPGCGSKLSLSKYDNHIFMWNEGDIDYINDLKIKIENNTTENANLLKDEEEQSKTSDSKSQNNSSKKKQRDLAKEEYKKQENEQRSAEKSKEENRKEDIKYGLQLLAGGSAFALILGFNFDIMSLFFKIITGAAALFFLLGAFLMLIGSKEE